MKILIRVGSGDWNPVDHKQGAPEIELQKLIVESPGLLPAEDLEVKFVVAVPEVELASPRGGSVYADILAFSNDGDIAIVECKRADNTDAKRKVIGQILEYASYLWKMNYEQLDSRIKKANWKNFHQSPSEVEGKSLAELFDAVTEEWDEENFRSRIGDSLEKGKFLLIVAVDEINDELKQAVKYLNESGKPAYSLYALEMRRFETGDIKILIPHLHPEAPQPTPRPQPIWDEESFFDDAMNKVDERTLSTLRELYAFSKDLGGVIWGTGKGGTFSASIILGSKPVKLYTIQSSGKRNWLNKKGLTELGVDKALIVEYIHRLKSLGLDENKNWDSLKYPEFNTSILNDDEKLASFKEATLKLKKALAQS